MFLHFSDPPFSAVILGSRIRHTIFRCGKSGRGVGVLNGPLVVDALRACKLLAKKELKSTRSRGLPSQFQDLKSQLPNEGRDADNLTDLILNYQPVKNLMKSDLQILQVLCVEKPLISIDKAIKLLDDYIAYQSINPKSINLTSDERLMSISWTMLRNAINDKHFLEAFKIVDLTNYKYKTNRSFSLKNFIKNYYYTLFKSANTKRYRNSLITAATVSTLSFSSLAFYLFSGTMASLIVPLTYLSIFLTYFIRWHLLPYPFYRASMFASIDSSLVAWAPSIGPRERFQRHHELAMVNRIIIGFNELVDVNVTNYHLHHKRPIPPIELENLIKNQVQSRGMKLMPTKDEIMYNDYWQSAGYNLSWVEPDQDPVDIKHPETS